MNYIEQIRFFWRSHEEHSFSTTEIALYFHLLEICNSCQWKNPFKRRNNKIEADLNISYNTLKNARNRLAQYNIISFKSQNGNSNVEYTLSIFDKVANEVTNEVYDEVYDEVKDEVVNEVSSEVSTRFLRGKHEVSSDININKTKTKIDIEKEIEKPLVFPFTSDLFIEKWKLLVSTPKWKVKANAGLQISLDTLAKYNEPFAIEVINQAIAGDWTMFKGFELDEYYKKYNAPPAKSQKEPSKRFRPPTVDEVKAYCIQRKNNVDPQKFVDFYQSKGWLVGKVKMKDWEACVRTWEQSEIKTGKVSKNTEGIRSTRDYSSLIQYAKEANADMENRSKKTNKPLINIDTIPPKILDKEISKEELEEIKKKLKEL